MYKAVLHYSPSQQGSGAHPVRGWAGCVGAGSKVFILKPAVQAEKRGFYLAVL